MASGPVTIAEVAAAAGVSVPTVSRVLNGRKGVSASKRDQIERLIVAFHRGERAGFEQHALAVHIVGQAGDDGVADRL